ncbi:MAG: excinuclease ABC subunit UvrC, partial [Bacteroidota bacterium]
LENSLIKNHQPKYNILLKDDKTYPYICVTKEPFPRIIVTRRVDEIPGKYYGPYTNVRAMNTVLELIRELYPIRTCHYSLTEKNIQARKFKVCLEYHIGNCLGPCEGMHSEEDYDKNMQEVHQILKGNINSVKRIFREKMNSLAEELAFEKAGDYKEKLERLDYFQSKSLVVNPKISDVDVFSIISDEKRAYLNYFKVKNGAVVHTKNLEIKKALDEPDEEILTSLAIDARHEYESEAPEIISNIPLNIEIPSVFNTIPKIGDKKKLLELSLKNVFFFKKDRTRKREAQSPKDQPVVAVQELQKVLNMDKPPMHIECFDNSNIQGTNPVAAMVYFKNGKPLKKEYRHYNIKTVIGPDDFSSMNEIVGRRYRRLLDEEKALPDLIVIDGGKGQLSAACQALKAIGIYGQIKIIGIAKRLEEIYLPEDDIPLHINKKSLALKLIQRARDEAHRFAIEFHRLKRSKSSLQSELTDIPGVGENTA